MTVLDIDRIIPAPPMTDTELTADEARRLHLMEETHAATRAINTASGSRRDHG
jgi:hypothetical protein